MAVNIDAVYQKVLALINKEQRGYLTPQEFKLLASKLNSCGVIYPLCSLFAIAKTF